MKDVRFLLQDYAELDSYAGFIETFYYFNPMTGREKDLIFNKLNNLISIPSLNWFGTFNMFRMHFEKQIKHEFLYPHSHPISPVSTERIKAMQRALTAAHHAEIQLRKNLDETYRAGFQLEPKYTVELWVGPNHPHFIKDKPEFNCIFAREYQMDFSGGSFKEDVYYFFVRNILQYLNETDLIHVDKLRLVYRPEYTKSFELT